MTPQLLPLATLLLLGSCAGVLDRPSRLDRPGRPAQQALQPGVVQGSVQDLVDRPVHAKAWLVSPGGSRSLELEGAAGFRFQDLPEREYVLTITTEDGRVAVLPGVRPGRPFELPPLTQGATLAVELRGPGRSRLSIEQAGQRVHEFTLRAGEPVEVVVPAGDLILKVYGESLELQRSLSLRPGDTRRLAFDA